MKGNAALQKPSMASPFCFGSLCARILAVRNLGVRYGPDRPPAGAEQSPVEVHTHLRAGGRAFLQPAGHFERLRRLERAPRSDFETAGSAFALRREDRHVEDLRFG